MTTKTHTLSQHAPKSIQTNPCRNVGDGHYNLYEGAAWVTIGKVVVHLFETDDGVEIEVFAAHDLERRHHVQMLDAYFKPEVDALRQVYRMNKKQAERNRHTLKR